jgi:hypothetical protein
MDSPKFFGDEAVKRMFLTTMGSIGGILFAAAGGFGIAILKTGTYWTVWHALAVILCGGVAACLSFRLARHEIWGKGSK